MLRKVSGTNVITCYYGGNSVHASQECSIYSTEITKNNIMSKMSGPSTSLSVTMIINLILITCQRTTEALRFITASKQFLLVISDHSTDSYRLEITCLILITSLIDPACTYISHSIAF